LETKIDLKNNRVQAYTIFPYAKVAVLGENGNTAVVAAQPEVIEQAMSLTNLTAQAALVVDKNSGVELFRKNEVEIRPIASLTKLMSVLTFFDYFPGWDKVVTLEKQDFVGGAALWAKAGDQITVKDLFYSTLVGSKNNTTVALARSTGLTVDQFVAKMNDKAKTMGLINSRFVEPTGLSEYNVSTAKEIMSIARELFKNPEALKASTTQWYKVKPLNSVNYYWVKNTSIKLLERDLYITGSKTGWTDEAGYCLVTQAKKNGQELLALVLGAKVRMNYEEVYYLLNNYLN
jgi:D-alanyl-D-alanine carboxypeptidase